MVEAGMSPPPPLRLPPPLPPVVVPHFSSHTTTATAMLSSKKEEEGGKNAKNRIKLSFSLSVAAVVAIFAVVAPREHGESFLFQPSNNKVFGWPIIFSSLVISKAVCNPTGETFCPRLQGNS